MRRHATSWTTWTRCALRHRTPPSPHSPASPTVLRACGAWACHKCAGFASLAERLDTTAVPSPQRMSIYAPSPPMLVDLLDNAPFTVAAADAATAAAGSEAEELHATKRESVYDLAALQGPVDANPEPVIRETVAEDTDEDIEP